MSRKYALFLILGVLVACGSPSAAKGPTTLEMDGTHFKVAGPHTHENLTVFLIVSDKPAEEEFITLDEGLKSGEVKVSEKEQEQVSELMIQNDSERPLFLQEGDRLRGGKQDRIVGISMVIPPKSGELPFRSFCVESGRWTQWSKGSRFEATDNDALASNSVRYASKIAQDQGRVWEQVAGEKKQMEEIAKSPNRSSSLNEMMDSEEVRKITKAYSEALENAIGSGNTVVGVAFAVNGEVQEVNIYPSHTLLRKLYPRLLRSYVIMAMGRREDEKKAVSSAEIVRFMTEGDRKSERKQDINSDNRFLLNMYEKKVQCDTQYKGAWVHRQWLNAPENMPNPGEGQYQEQRRNNDLRNDIPNRRDVRQELPQREEPQNDDPNDQ